ncbi:MAG: SMC-Scp complex subunit ScpB [Candidatus Woesearchaeota archaeon]
MTADELKNKLEALLFSSGKKLSLGFLTGLTGAKESDVLSALKGLAKDYEGRDCSLMVFQEGNEWKISVREKYVSLVRKIVADTELSKTVLETLAIIAWKSPVLQSAVVNIRSNKAYDHIAELEELGFIAREKKGRSFLIRTTEKFFEYFDIGDKKDFKKLLKDKQGGQKQLGELEVVSVEKKSQKQLDGLEIVNIPNEKKQEVELSESEKIDWQEKKDESAEDGEDSEETGDDSEADEIADAEKTIEELAKEGENKDKKPDKESDKSNDEQEEDEN